VTYRAHGAVIRCGIGAIAPQDDPIAIIRGLISAEPPPIKRAWATVALSLGMPHWLIRKVWQGDVVQVSDARAALIRARHADALRARIRRLDADRAAVIARLDKLRGTRGDAEMACRDASARGGALDRRRPLLPMDGRTMP
jgi:hypothetical protein